MESPVLHQTNSRHAITNLEMPAMSPTMTEGGIASWKKREGESFTTGDVLLEIVCDNIQVLAWKLPINTWNPRWFFGITGNRQGNNRR